MPRTSVIIPADDSHDTIWECLRALREQAYRDFEVLVVSSSPAGALDARILADHPEVRLIHGDDARPLPHAARNRGVQAATGEIFAFTDPDCKPRPDWLRWIVNAVDTGHHAVAGLVLPPPELDRFERAMQWARFPMNMDASTRAAEPGRDMTTANVTYSRLAWDMIGPFDERFWCGDTLLALAAVDSGIVPWFESRAVVERVGRHDASRFWQERFERGRDLAWARWSLGKRTRGSALRTLGRHATHFPRFVARTANSASETRHLGEWLTGLPLQLGSQLAWLAGESSELALQVGLGERFIPPTALAPRSQPLRRVVIVGAGPAGLAVGALLAQGGVRATLLERGAEPGAAWHAHYESLRLHTTKERSALPGQGFDAAVGRYPTQREVADYLGRYAQSHDLDVRTGHEVTCVERVENRWRVTTSQGAFDTTHVVIASGFNRVPVRPVWAERHAFPGLVLHSSQLRTTAEYRGRRVLVVGLGNTGADLAVALENGGARVAIAQREPAFWIPLDVWRKNWREIYEYAPGAAFSLSRRLGRSVGGSAERLSAWLWHRVQQGAYGDLGAKGLRLASVDQILARWNARLPPLTRDELAPPLRKGRIQVLPEVMGLDATGARFVDGTAHVFDVVILATGFRAGIPDYLVGAEAWLDETGIPRNEAVPAAAPGLFFCGYRPELRQIVVSANAIARAILGKLGG